jgi:hypothetical protein
MTEPDYSRRTAELKVRVEPKLVRPIKAAAAEQGHTVSSWLRILAIRAIREEAAA